MLEHLAEEETLVPEMRRTFTQQEERRVRTRMARTVQSRAAQSERGSHARLESAAAPQLST